MHESSNDNITVRARGQYNSNSTTDFYIIRLRVYSGQTSTVCSFKILKHLSVSKIIAQSQSLFKQSQLL